MLRAAIHIIGDMHQPLHNLELFDDNYKKGDRGGNRISIDENENKQKISNLHNLWDGYMGFYPQAAEDRTQTVP